MAARNSIKKILAVFSPSGLSRGLVRARMQLCKLVGVQSKDLTLVTSDPVIGRSTSDLNAISRFQAMEGLNPQVKRKILSDNPRRFYGFGPSYFAHRTVEKCRGSNLDLTTQPGEILKPLSELRFSFDLFVDRSTITAHQMLIHTCKLFGDDTLLKPAVSMQ
jgi:hypothetical protein